MILKLKKSFFQFFLLLLIENLKFYDLLLKMNYFQVLIYYQQILNYLIYNHQKYHLNLYYFFYLN